MTSVQAALSEFERKGVYRALDLGADGLLDFSSNDYLGLARNSSIRTRLVEALASGCPLGATGSRLLSGQTAYHERVESYLARVFAAPSALLFSSGFLANMGVMAAFSQLQPHFFSDEFNHASLVDGMRMLKAPKTIFRHNDMNELEEALRCTQQATKVIVSESVFSMDGDLAPVEDLVELARRYSAWLVIDEAHATGVFGLGRIAHSVDVPLVTIHTGGKALGAQGAFVLASKEFRALVINSARSFIYSTALAPLSVLQIEFAIDEILREPERGFSLLIRAESWRRALPAETLGSGSQIIPVVLGSNERALRAAGGLRDLGCDVRAIRSPTVPVGSERLRIALKADHSENDLERLRLGLMQVAQ